jgi:glycosyltransferase involved in cell wall biosynthesis
MSAKELSPLVSVIIPTRDRTQTLTRAVNSVARQTYKNIELVIVVDGSNYHVATPTINDAEFRSFRVTVVQNTHRPGPPGARNTGFDRSKGAFVAFLDDDDEWLPEKIEKQVAVLQQCDESVGIVCTHDIHVTRNTKEIRRRSLQGNVYSLLCKAHTAGNTSNPLIRRRVLGEIGLFDESLPAGQDTDLWLRIAKRYEFRTIDEPLVLVYRDDRKRISDDSYKQLIGAYLFLRKHGADLHLHRKSRIVWSMFRLVVKSILKRINAVRPVDTETYVGGR